MILQVNNSWKKYLSVEFNKCYFKELTLFINE